MKKWIFLIVLSLAAAVGGLGCAALSHYVTPAEIDSQAVGYAVEAGVADSNEFAGFANLYKAQRLTNAVADAHEINQFELNTLAQKDNLKFTQFNDITSLNLQNARQKEEQLFGDKGLLSMGLSLAGFGTLTGLIGLMRKRPGDVTPEQLKTAVSGTEAQVTDREQQVFELVRGIQKFLDIERSTTAAARLKDELAKQQSVETKKIVAQMKTRV